MDNAKDSAKGQLRRNNVENRSVRRLVDKNPAFSPERDWPLLFSSSPLALWGETVTSVAFAQTL